MLLPRILSAIVMACLFFVCIFLLEEKGFSVVMGVVVFIAGWEWARLSGVVAPFARLSFSVVIGIACFCIVSLGLEKQLLFLSPVLWGIAFYWVCRYPQPLIWKYTLSRLSFGLLVLVSAWSALVVLKQSENFLVWVLLLMGLIWGADSGAYFAGKAFGKHKLAPHVSPGKSWEGVIGGLLVTQLGIALFSVIKGFSSDQWLWIALVALLTVLVSVLGDLTESLFKRHESLKDSGNLIPGHGGVMDRVDSLTAAAPIFVLLIAVMGWL